MIHMSWNQIQLNIYVYIHTRIYAHINIYMYVCMHIYIYIYIYLINKYINIHMCTYISIKNIHTHEYIYIYITNLLSTSIHGYQKKEKKNRQDLEIIISRITARGKKKKKHRPKKKKEKKRPTLSQQLKKIKRYAISWSKKKKKRKKKTHRKVLQCYKYRECSIQSRANYKNLIASRAFPTKVSPHRLLRECSTDFDSLMNQWCETLIGKSRLAI